MAAPILVAEEVAGGGLGLLIVALFAYLKGSLLRLLRIALWSLGGREHLERKLAAAGIAPVLTLSPWLDELLTQAGSSGRPVYLVSRRCSPLLEAIIALNPAIAGTFIVARGLTSRRGTTDLLARFPQGYDAVVKRRGAIKAIWHEPEGTLNRGIDANSPNEGWQQVLPRAAVVRELARSLRLHQCVKNIVVLVPLVLSGRFTVVHEIADGLLAFVALCLVASGTYILNDIWDVADDRAHWSKKERPIASGRVSAATALALAVLLIPAGLALAGFMVSWQACVALLTYLGLTLGYSLYLKTVPFLDGMTLAALFTIRVGIGMVSNEARPSAWLLVFSMFLFGSLSYAKRYTEISRTIATKPTALGVRGYRMVDAPMVLTLGLSAGIGAVLIMVLYIVEEAFLNSFYGSTGWLWGFPPLMFLFVIRIWTVTVRGEMMDDPVAFAIKDKACLGLLALMAICFGFAWLG